MFCVGTARDSVKTTGSNTIMSGNNMMKSSWSTNLLLKIKKLDDTAIIPTKAHRGDLGWDFYSLEDVTILPGETKRIKTGIAVGLPEGFGMILKERSSMGAKGVALRGGVIDNGYTGEIQVMLTNLNMKTAYPQDEFTLKNRMVPDKRIEIRKGDKICQGVIQKVHEVNLIEVESLDDTSRGDKGFGSSGK